MLRQSAATVVMRFKMEVQCLHLIADFQPSHSWTVRETCPTLLLNAHVVGGFFFFFFFGEKH